ncbi:unnamed protein product [Protopolystoma xenopodis]|uniref:Uncharacterized protein n=1 Tax=Protopolystoma xenopodis TaxID=117903 RepID=A0A448XBZ8_9PLAT|nr:unnamed protein product [Protopolystoma xenopodis]
MRASSLASNLSAAKPPPNFRTVAQPPEGGVPAIPPSAPVFFTNYANNSDVPVGQQPSLPWRHLLTAWYQAGYREGQRRALEEQA